MCAGLAGRVTLATKYGSTHLRMKRHLVVLSAIIANYVEAFRAIVGIDRFL